MDYGPFEAVPLNVVYQPTTCVTSAVTTTTVLTTTATSQTTCQTTPSSQCPLAWFASVASTVNSVSQTSQCSLSWFADVASSQQKVEMDMSHSESKTTSCVSVNLSDNQQNQDSIPSKSTTQHPSKRTKTVEINNKCRESFSMQTQTPKNLVVSIYVKNVVYHSYIYIYIFLKPP